MEILDRRRWQLSLMCSRGAGDKEDRQGRSDRGSGGDLFGDCCCASANNKERQRAG